MNINFNTLFQKLLPYIYVMMSAFLIDNFIFLYLPKKGIDFAKNESLILNYKKYNFYTEAKNATPTDIVVDTPKQNAQTLTKYNLKAVYYTNITTGYVVVEDTVANVSYILGYNEKLDDYVLSKLYKDYVIFIKDKKEYKLELKDSFSENLNKSKNDSGDGITIKDDGAIISRNYLNSYTSNIENIWNNISISETKNGDKLDGFKVDKINKDSAFTKLGLKEGDVIKSVNNKVLNSNEDVFKLFSDLNNIKYINIEVMRNNKIVELNYEIN